MLEGINPNNSIRGATLVSSFAKQTPPPPCFLIMNQQKSAQTVRIIEAIMSNVPGFSLPCLVGCSAVCFMILSPKMFSKQLPSLVCGTAGGAGMLLLKQA